jgi:hypothetical protein
MAVIKKTAFPKDLDRFNVLVNDTAPNSRYFRITELPDTFTGGKNAFLIAGTAELVPDTKIQIELKDSVGNIIYHEPGEGLISSSVNNVGFVSEYFEGVSKVVAVYIYPETLYGPCTLTILGEVDRYQDGNGILTPVPIDWIGKYNVKWQKQINVNPSLANTTKIRFYQRPTATITEILSPIYSIVGNNKVASAVTQSFANIKLSKLETFAGDVKRVKVFRTSQGDISDYDLIQDILVESKELLTSYGLSGSVVGQTGILTSETLKNNWNTGSLNAFLTSSRVESGVRLTGSGYFTYTSSLDIKSANTYELNLDAFYSSSTSSNLGVYLSQVTTSGDGITPTIISSSITTLIGTQPTKNLLDTVIPFKLDRNYPSASLYFSQSQGEWHLGNISLKLSQDTAFSPDEVSFVTTMPTVLGNETFNFKFEFYDVNNNYVPVAVTQSATFNGGNTNIGGTILLISSSTSQSLADLNRVSSSISGTATLYSSSANTTIVTLSGSVSSSITVVSGSVVTLSGSVSGSITTVSSSVVTLSGSLSASIATTLSSSFAKVQQLANGGYPGTFIENDIIYSPVIGGQLGYFSTLFKVGTAPSIYLDARQNPRKIFIGGAIPSGQTEYSGAYNNTNTNVYLDSTGKFSLGNKLTFDGSNLSVNGSITITNPSTANNGGAVGSFSNGDAITGGSIAGVTIAPTKIHIGTGTFGNANTSFYVDNAGQFSLKDKLSWNGTTLSITGDINISGGDAATKISNAALSGSNAQSTANTAASSAAAAQSTANTAVSAAAFALINANTASIFTDSTGKIVKTPTTNTTGLFLGSTNMGYYSGGAWKTYMANNGNFYLDGTDGYLSWNSTTDALAIKGNIIATNITALTTGNIAGWGIDSQNLGTNRLKLNSSRPAVEIYDTTGKMVVDINSNAGLSARSEVSLTPSPTSFSARTTVINGASYEERFGYTAKYGVDTTIYTHAASSTLAIPAGSLVGKTCTFSAQLGAPTVMSFEVGGDDGPTVFYVNHQEMSCRVGFKLTAPDSTITYVYEDKTNSYSTQHLNPYTLTITPSALISTAVTLQQGTYTITPFITNIFASATLSTNNDAAETAVFSVIAYSPYLSSIAASVPVSKTEMVAGGFQVVFNSDRYCQIERANNADFVSIGGGLTCTGDVTANTSSDKRWKDNIIPIDNPIEKIKKLTGNSFVWKDGFEVYHSNKGLDYGVIAQEVEEVMPEIVIQRDGGYKGVRYEKIIPLLIEAIKEQQKQIEELKKNR